MMALLLDFSEKFKQLLSPNAAETSVHDHGNHTQSSSIQEILPVEFDSGNLWEYKNYNPSSKGASLEVQGNDSELDRLSEHAWPSTYVFHSTLYIHSIN
jgi:hypothetical protein